MEVAIDQRKQVLENAFASFNRVSEDLTFAYSQLEERVDSLQAELTETRNEKFHQLVEKEKLADRLSILLRNLPAGVIVLDGYGNIIEHNEIAAKLIGTELTEKSWKEIAELHLAPGYSGNCEVSLSNGKRISLKVESQERSEGKIIILNDVTAEYNFRESINRKERLESLGNMVASLAHQVRTPLSAAFLYLSSLEKRTKKQEISYQLIENIKHCLHGLEATVNDMLGFAKGEWQLSDVLDISSLSENMRNDIDREFGMNLIDMHVNCKDKNQKVSINYIAFWGAIKNVIQNAIQANNYDSKALVEISDKQEEIIFSIHDKGEGISDELKEKIFEPFFTTKAGGTGLGLAVVKSIIEAHHGKVEAKTNNFNGACINICIPKHAEFSPITSSNLNKETIKA